ncbi:HV01 protein, partial [Ibidorhyncha struthersii]|nr:HV01 protein [Ibidorhyncha struthersii]
LRAPGDSVLLSCRGSGFDFGNYEVLWYRQAPGGRLDWLSIISPDSSVIQFGQSVEGRATGSRDNSQSGSSLSLHALHPQDSACYFCAAPTEAGNPSEV